MVNLKEVVFSNIFLKVNSFIIAFLIWAALSSMITIRSWIEVPLNFFNHEQDIKIKAPQKIKIQISGKKKIIDEIDKNICAYVDVKTLSLGDNPYILTSDNLYFPPSIALVDYYPRNLIINLEKTSK